MIKLTKKQMKKLQALVGKLQADENLLINADITESIELADGVTGTVNVSASTYGFTKKFVVSARIELKY